MIKPELLSANPAQTPKKCAETTMQLQPDMLSQILSPMRIRGSVVLAEEYMAPWGIRIPDGAELGRLLAVNPPARAIAFHMATKGVFDLVLANGTTMTLGVGEIAICAGGLSHTIARGSGRLLSLEAITGMTENPFRPTAYQHGAVSGLICGIFELRNTYLNPLFVALPPVMRIRLFAEECGEASLNAATLLMKEMARRDVGALFLIERILEMLYLEAIRAYIQTDADDAAGWFRGMRDPLVQQALALIHNHPEYELSVKKLADHVGLSDSRFAARFTAMLQQSPMAYVTAWRIYCASYLLQQEPNGVEEIAVRVGYTNFTAFSRAFKRAFGMTPSAWRHDAQHFLAPVAHPS